MDLIMSALTLCAQFINYDPLIYYHVEPAKNRAILPSFLYISYGRTGCRVQNTLISCRTSVSWRVQVQLLPFGMYTEEVQDTLQKTDVPRLNFTWAYKSIILKVTKSNVRIIFI